MERLLSVGYAAIDVIKGNESHMRLPHPHKKELEELQQIEPPAMTKSLARGLSKYNILVNAVAPGTIDTQMSRRMKPEDREKNAQMSLVKRLGTPEDVAGGVMFLLSKDADYITGFTLDVNGGLYIR